jgi:DNA-binding NarL/FixJ family response regulator
MHPEMQFPINRWRCAWPPVAMAAPRPERKGMDMSMNGAALTGPKDGWIAAALDDMGHALATRDWASATRLVDGLRSALAGSTPRGAASGSPRNPDPEASAELWLEPLRARELEVLQLIAAGHSNQEVAAHLIVAVGTIRWHLKNIYSKLDVHNRTQAVARARALGLLA